MSRSYRRTGSYNNYASIDNTYSRKKLGYNPYVADNYTTQSLFDKKFDSGPLLASIPSGIPDKIGNSLGNLSAGTGLIAGAASFAPSLAPVAAALAPVAAAAGVGYGIYKVGQSLSAW
jgi:hypothetical protein